MKKNKMLSLAAAMVLTTTTVMAFESDYDGQIHTMNGATKINAAYTVANANPAAALLTRSSNQFGDALVYPTFTTKNGWETEIKVTNSSLNAVVAKVVLYAKSDSRELRDFNIYLSAKDVFSFKIANGALTTRDGSYAKSVKFPDNTPVTSSEVVNMVDHENETVGITTLGAGEEEGYVVIYGMAEVTGHNYHTPGSSEGHENLFRDYRKNLDNCRPGWGAAFSAGSMINGMMTVAVESPNVLDACNAAAVVPAGDNRRTDANGRKIVAAPGDVDTAVDAFTTVSEDALSGTVTISQAAGTNSRDMVIPATALSNFTDDENPTMLLWTEGEYAAIADRHITTALGYTDTLGIGAAGPIEADANSAFAHVSSTYTYSEGSLQNELIFTQPMKRILVQLGDQANYYTGEAYSTAAATLGNTTNYGYFQTATTIYNENEITTQVAGVSQAIISPYNSSQATIVKFEDEVAVIANIEDLAATADNASDFANSGYAEVVTTAPAIVTQMIGSVAVDGDAQVNWVYAPSK